MTLFYQCLLAGLFDVVVIVLLVIKLIERTEYFNQLFEPVLKTESNLMSLLMLAVVFSIILYIITALFCLITVLFPFVLIVNFATLFILRNLVLKYYRSVYFLDSKIIVIVPFSKTKESMEIPIEGVNNVILVPSFWYGHVNFNNGATRKSFSVDLRQYSKETLISYFKMRNKPIYIKGYNDSAARRIN